MNCVAAGKPAHASVSLWAKRPNMTHTYERAFYGLQGCFSSLLLGIARHTKLIEMACFPELNLL